MSRFGVAQFALTAAVAGIPFSETGTDQDYQAIDGTLHFDSTDVRLQFKSTARPGRPHMKFRRESVEKWRANRLGVVVVMCAGVDMGRDGRTPKVEQWWLWANDPSRPLRYGVAHASRWRRLDVATLRMWESLR